MSTPVQALAAGLHRFGAAADNAASQGFAGFLAFDPAAAIVSVADTDATGGVYLFADQGPDDPEGFAARVRRLLARIDPRGRVRALWLRGAGRSDPTAVLSIEVENRGAGPVLAAPCYLQCCGYGVLLSAGCSLALEADTLIVRRPPAADPRTIAWITRAGIGRLPADPGADLRIPVATGTLGFPLTLSPADSTHRSGLDVIDANLRYFFDASQDPDVPIALPDGLASLDYPVFDASAGDIRMHAQIDPIRPLDPERSHLSFIAPGANETQQILRSHFVDRLGAPLWLRPIVRDGLRPRLVFAASPAYGPGGGAALGSNVWTYLCPEGHFEIVDRSAGKPPAYMLAGLSGLEYFRFESAAANRLLFVPHQAALASGFRFGAASPPGSSRWILGSASNANAGAIATLGTHATTSHVYLQGPQRTVYYAQPDSGTLWMAGEADAFLEYMELDAGELPDAGGPSAPRSLPIAPYRGIDGRRDALLRELEAQTLSPVRRKTLYDYTSAQTPGSPLATPASRAVTTLGLLAEFEPATNAWKSLTLAMPKDRLNPLQLVGANVEGKTDPKGITGPLRAALQTNRLFMVISGGDFTKYGALANPIAAIEGWSFNLDPAVWSKHGTILLFKFNDRPITDMLADTREWAGAEHFNGKENLEATRRRLAQIIADARAEVQSGGTEAEASLGEFVRIVESPQWQGVLALDVDLPLGGLPDEIAMLAAGIDASKFKAHHFGVTLAPVHYEFAKEPEMDPSAHFGLIRYQEPPATGAGASGPYDYRVESLMVRFYNSLVVDFSSTVRLKVGALFGDPVRTTPQPDGSDPTIFKLLGVLERHDGQAAYSFASQQAKLLAVDSHVLTDVVVQKVEQKTTAAPDAAKGGISRGYFQFRGFARFAQLPDLDAFSFGTGKGVDGGGLAFERMLLHMEATLPPAGQETVGTPTWRFDISETILDGAKSRARPQSLYGRFPIKVSTFAQAAGSAPTAAGFIPVATPLVESKMGNEWYGLKLELDLGTAGALVSNRSFTANLLLAWSPHSGSKPITFVGLRLPGSNGAQKSFKLQGLFDIKIADIALLAHGDASHTSYTMVLRNIAFDLMRLRFPMVGSVNFMLFGDPNGAGKPNSLGWYLAYAK